MTRRPFRPSSACSFAKYGISTRQGPHGVEYTYLLAGAPAEMWEKVPQLNHLDTWPATIFVGRDGKIDAVHSGFASPAAGEFHTQLKQDFTARIEKLLAEKAPTKVAAAGGASLK